MKEYPYRIILGSRSPRRRELMAGLDIAYEAISLDIDERYPQYLERENIPIYVARAKARAYEQKLQIKELLITSDTIVWIDHQMLGKPRDMAEAKQMLQILRSATHQVYTAVCFVWVDKQGLKHEKTLTDETNVTFRYLTDEEINYYVNTYKPFDKAGAYGVQEWIGYIGVTRMEGSYFNVMGFPVEKVWETLSQISLSDTNIITEHN